MASLPTELPGAMVPPLITSPVITTVGFAISLFTIAATSARTSRMNIIAAIRDLPNVRTHDRGRRWTAAGLAAFASVGVRYWRSRGEERQQIRWLAFAVALPVGGCAGGDPAAWGVLHGHLERGESGEIGGFAVSSGSCCLKDDGDFPLNTAVVDMATGELVHTADSSSATAILPAG